MIENPDEWRFCPNCKEEVPNTLYCLNCGFPLHKTKEDPSRLAILQAKLSDRINKTMRPLVNVYRRFKYALYPYPPQFFTPRIQIEGWRKDLELLDDGFGCGGALLGPKEYEALLIRNGFTLTRTFYEAPVIRKFYIKEVSK